ncbi:MAG: PAS domain S-box protein [Lacinutrix venerupis]
MSVKIAELEAELFQTIFNQANEGISIVSLEGEWIKVNKSVLDTLGYTENELYAMTFKDITHKDDLELDLNKMTSLLSGEISNYTMKKRYFHKKGHVIWARLSVSLVRNDLGRPLYFISQISDISNVIKNELKIKSMLGIVKAQNERLSDFTEIVTHNLKTHVSNLSTLVGFIEQDIPEVKPKEEFIMLKDSVLNLNDTVKHLTEISKITVIKENNLETLSLCNYVDKAIYNISALAKNFNCKFVNNINSNCKVKAIPAYLDSIILNFLTNAIKYRSKERQLVVTLQNEIQGEYNVLQIEDNGLGIDLNKFGDSLFKLYKTFHYNDDATGVGLFITKNHIESMGGKIEVESEVNKGTVFRIYFKKG